MRRAELVPVEDGVLLLLTKEGEPALSVGVMSWDEFRLLRTSLLDCESIDLTAVRGYLKEVQRHARHISRQLKRKYAAAAKV